MSKELEYIQRHIDIVKQQVKGSKVKFTIIDVVTKHQYDFYENELQTLESIEQALNRLEAIDNANPSEALYELKRIDCNITYLLSDCDINEEVSVCLNSIRDNKSCEIIKQYILKAQEPKQYVDELKLVEKKLKALEIIKEKNVDVDYFLFWSKQGNLGTVEDYNHILKHKNGRYQRLLLTEEEFDTLKEVLE